KFSQFRGPLGKYGSGLRIPVKEIGVDLGDRSGKHHGGARELRQISGIWESVVAERVGRIPAQTHAESVVHNEIWKGKSIVLAVIPNVAKRTSDLNRVPTACPDCVVFDLMHGNLMAKSAAEVLDVGKGAHIE